jgi:uncharacterized protein
MLDSTDLQDILNGSCIVGCGGGGPYDVGRALVDLLHPNTVQLVDLNDVRDDEQAVVVGVVGAMDLRVRSVTPTVTIRPSLFTGALQGGRQTPGVGGGKSISYVVPFEIGAGNSFVPMVVAAALGLRVVDASGVDRAVPVLAASALASHGVPVSPIVLADEAHDVTLQAKNAVDADRKVNRAITGARSTFPAGYATIAAWSMSGAALKSAAMPATLTRARLLGRALREARARGDDPVRTVQAFLSGKIECIGKVGVNIDQAARKRFDEGVVPIETPQGLFTVYKANENLVLANPHGQPVVCAPDLICYLRTNGDPLTNAELRDVIYGGRPAEVAVISAPANPELRDPSIVRAFQRVGRRFRFPSCAASRPSRSTSATKGATPKAGSR